MQRAIIILLLLCVPGSCGNRFLSDLSRAALKRTDFVVIYDGSYRAIGYPMGDVASSRGVCTDVVIRSYRKLGVDLQVLIHEDMKASFSSYPARKLWGQRRTDTNIDHRRVPNLRVFFKRHGQELPITRNGQDYKPGDLVTWILDNDLPHIGIVVDKYSKDKKRPLIVHNIGWGPKLEDMLFDYKITGHYRYIKSGYKSK